MFCLSFPVTFSSLYPKGQLQERQLATGLELLCASTSTDTARRRAAAPARAGAMHGGSLAQGLGLAWRSPYLHHVAQLVTDAHRHLHILLRLLVPLVELALHQREVDVVPDVP